MPSVLEVQEFFVEGRDPGKAHVLLHIAEPTAPHEKERGYLFALVEIAQGSPEQIQKFQELIDEVETAFYAKEERREYLLERVLQNINKKGGILLDYPGSAIHCIVGTIRGQAVALAYHGAPIAALIYSGGEHLEATEIISPEPTDSGTALFSEIVEGSMGPGDYIYVATPHVGDHFTPDRVRKLAESRTTRQSMAHIQKVLSDLGSDYSFGGILFHLTDHTDTPRTGAQPKIMDNGSAESLNKLMASARSTAETLSPPLLGDVGKNLKSLLKKRAADTTVAAENLHPAARVRTVETNHRYGDGPAEREGVLGQSLVMLGRAVIYLVHGLIEIVRRLFVGLIRAGQIVFVLSTNWRRGRARIIRDWRLAAADKRQWLTSLPLVSKIILSCTLVLALAFVGSLGYIQVQEKRTASEQKYLNLIAAIRDKKDAAEASLIYADKTKASELIREAQALAAGLPQEKTGQQQTAAELKTSLAQVAEKLRNLKTVPAELIADIGAAYPEARTEKLVKIGGEIIAYGPADSKFYAVGLAAKEIKVKNNDVAPELAFALVPAEEDKVVFLSRGYKAAEYDPKTGVFLAKTIGLPAEGTQVDAAGIYNRKLYLAVSAQKQIYKHSPTQTGYDKGTAWLKQTSESLADARSLAIDGEIFILKNNGEIKKYFTGEEQPFTVNGVEPSLAQPTQIVTNADLKEIFILESSNRRLVVLNKTGAFETQYTAEEWQSPSGIAVEDGGKTVYVLDANKIYRLSL